MYFKSVKNGAGLPGSSQGAQAHLRDGDGREYLPLNNDAIGDNCMSIHSNILCGDKVRLENY